MNWVGMGFLPSAVGDVMYKLHNTMNLVRERGNEVVALFAVESDVSYGGVAGRSNWLCQAGRQRVKARLEERRKRDARSDGLREGSLHAQR